MCHCFGKPTEINRKVSLFYNFINIIILSSYIVHSLPKNIPLKKPLPLPLKPRIDQATKHYTATKQHYLNSFAFPYPL